MTRKIMAVWTCPENDNSSHYRVGFNSAIGGWRIGEIEVVLDNTIFNLDSRVVISDNEGRIRVSLPARACAWEYKA